MKQAYLGIELIIQQTRELQDVLRCLPFESEVKKKGRDRSKLKNMLAYITSQLANPLFRIWIAYDSEENIGPDDNILGYCIAFINIMPGMKGIYLYRMYAKDSDIRKEFEKILRAWAKEYKVTKVMMTIYKNVRAIKRKYGFIPVSVNMERRI